MPNIRTFQTRLHRHGQSLGFNFRQLRHTGGAVITPYPTIKEKPDLRKRWADATSEKDPTVLYYEAHISADAIASTLFPTSVRSPLPTTQSVGVGQSIPLTATAYNAQGLPMAGVPVTFRIQSGGGDLSIQTGQTEIIAAPLQVDARWELSENEGATWEELRILVAPIQWAARWIICFVKIGDPSLPAEGVGAPNLTLFYPDDDGLDQQLQCWVWRDRTPTTVDEAITQEEIRLIGRVVFGTNGRFTPVDLPLGRRVEAILTDSVSGVVMQGEFRPDPQIPEKYPAISRRLGSRVSGYFLMTGSGRD